MPIILMVVIFYLVLFLPMRRRQKKLETMLSGLKNGDRVVTNGGLLGTIVAVADDNSVTIRVKPDNVKLQFARSSITGLVEDEAREEVSSRGSGNAPWKRYESNIVGKGPSDAGADLWLPLLADRPADIVECRLAHLAQRMRLGLDLKGGTHLILQVQVQDAMKAEADQLISAPAAGSGSTEHPRGVDRAQRPQNH